MFEVVEQDSLCLKLCAFAPRQYSLEGKKCDHSNASPLNVEDSL